MTTGLSFSTFKIVDGLKIKYDRLRVWIDKGYIPISEKATGQGSRAKFSLFDAYMIQLFIHLLENGFSREDAARRIKSFVMHDRKFKRGETNYDPAKYIFVALVKKTGSVAYTRLLKEVEVKSKPFLDLFLKHKLVENFDNVLIVNFAKIVKDVNVKLSVE